MPRRPAGRRQAPADRPALRCCNQALQPDAATRRSTGRVRSQQRREQRAASSEPGGAERPPRPPCGRVAVWLCGRLAVWPSGALRSRRPIDPRDRSSPWHARRDQDDDDDEADGLENGRDVRLSAAAAAAAAVKRRTHARRGRAGRSRAGREAGVRRRRRRRCIVVAAASDFSRNRPAFDQSAARHRCCSSRPCVATHVSVPWPWPTRHGRCQRRQPAGRPADPTGQPPADCGFDSAPGHRGGALSLTPSPT
jgi:hypothetical protein